LTEPILFGSGLGRLKFLIREHPIDGTGAIRDAAGVRISG
jgi:hypothetical protein